MAKNEVAYPVMSTNVFLSAMFPNNYLNNVLKGTNWSSVCVRGCSKRDDVSLKLKSSVSNSPTVEPLNVAKKWESATAHETASAGPRLLPSLQGIKSAPS